MRVLTYLANQHIPFETLLLAPAFTAARRAHYLHVPGKMLAKSVLLGHQRGYLLAVVPATHHVDLGAAAVFAAGPVCLATAAEMACTFRDCEWGVLAPFGNLYDVPTLLDTSFDPDAELVFEAHLHSLAIRMRLRDFERLEQPRRLRLTQQARALNPPCPPRTPIEDSGHSTR
jgi:Ala-tRNA(Pro) deacylase